jgi:hypothetical protein
MQCKEEKGHAALKAKRDFATWYFFIILLHQADRTKVL